MTSATPASARKPAQPQPSVNELAWPLTAKLVDDAGSLRLSVSEGPGGCVIVDAGIDAAGGLEAGRRIAEICLGGLGSVALVTGGGERWPLTVHVHTADPVLACLASQYAGWSLSHGKGKGAFNALGSGPGRALARKEPLFQELAYQDDCDRTCLVLEVDKTLPPELVQKIASDCGVHSKRLTLILTPTTSLAGNVQVVARVVEVAMHKAHELGFPLQQIVDAAGSAPLSPPSRDFITAMGRTNDAILFGGTVQLYVDSDDEAARRLAEQLPSGASRDYGRPFAEVFAAYDHDFFKIDPHLFSPARVLVTALRSGRTYGGGRLDQALLDKSFGGPV
jgi:methenyltetrahydromethanopterin cyclohydrolase